MVAWHLVSLGNIASFSHPVTEPLALEEFSGHTELADQVLDHRLRAFHCESLGIIGPFLRVGVPQDADPADFDFRAGAERGMELGKQLPGLVLECSAASGEWYSKRHIDPLFVDNRPVSKNGARAILRAGYGS